MNGQIRQRQSIWPKQRTNPFAVGFVLALLVSLLVVALLVLIFGWGWTGFGPESSEPKQHAKTLWDWLQLLIIPSVLVVGGFSLNLIQKRREDEARQEYIMHHKDVDSDARLQKALDETIKDKKWIR